MHWSRVTRGLVLNMVLALVLASGAPVVTAQPAAGYVPIDHFTIDCATLLVLGKPVVTPDAGEVECGVVQVPEDWNRHDGRVVDITYAILRSTSPNPEPDPVVYLEGGPGASALLGMASYVEVFAELRAERDVILYDQRGTHYSSELRCSMLTFESLLGSPDTGDDAAGATPTGVDEAATVDLMPDADPDVVLDSARQSATEGPLACMTSLLGEGVDLRQYNSIASGRDLVALLNALGIEEYNLYGISYGTRLALVMMRDHPDTGLRSVILDSTFPPEIRGFELYPAEAHEVVIQLFADCENDPVCNEAYPDLKERFVALLHRLTTEPVESPDGTVVTAVDLATLMMTISQIIPAVPYIPLMITELEAGATTTYQGIVSGALPGAGSAAVPEVTAEGDGGTPQAVDPFIGLPQFGGDGEPLSLAELFINSVELRARALAKDDQDAAIFLLTMLDALPRTEETLRQYVDLAFRDDDMARDRAALLGLINVMTEDDVREVFDLLHQTISLVDQYMAGINQAVFNSVECNEEVPFQRFDQTVAVAERLEIPELTVGVLDSIAAQFAACEIWPSGRAPEVEALPVASDIPTLILAGAYDMQTPVSWNKSAFVTLPNASLVEFPMSGHGVIMYSECAKEVTRQFIDQPWAAPDTSCVVELKPVWAMPGDTVPVATPVATPQG